ncbi:MAG: class C sortase [Bacilli bacterium]|nr:class C sortase [Bacilli bacterium]
MTKKKDINKKNDSKKISNTKSNIILVIVSIIMFLLGSLIFFYPTISNYIANKEFGNVIQTYNNKIEKISEEDLSSELEKAKRYNNELNGYEIHDPFEPGTGYIIPGNYKQVLNIAGDGVMAYIEIPKIKLRLPIYHTSSEKVLEKGVGHLESTALPIGGEGNNPILTGHRGLPQAELFTRLDELKKGSIINIHVLNDHLSYEVDSIKVIKPDEVSTLGPVKGKDMITLITCTPYGINTHRLVVQGKRVPYVPPKKYTPGNETVKLTESMMSRIYGVIAGIIILIIILFILKKRKNRNGKKD